MVPSVPYPVPSSASPSAGRHARFPPIRRTHGRSGVAGAGRQAGIQRIARGKVVGVQIADDCLGFDFQQPAEVFRHVLEELERLKVFQVAHMLAEESILGRV